MSTKQNSDLMKTAAVALRTLQQTNEVLSEKVASYERREAAEEVVAVMDSRGLFGVAMSHKDKVASVLSSGRDLSMLKEAARMSPTDMSFARVSADAGPSSNQSSWDRFQNFLVTGGASENEPQ